MVKKATPKGRRKSMFENEDVIEQIINDLPDDYYENIKIEKADRDSFGLSKLWKRSFGTGYRTLTEEEIRAADKFEATAREFHQRSIRPARPSPSLKELDL